MLRWLRRRRQAERLAQADAEALVALQVERRFRWQAPPPDCTAGGSWRPPRTMDDRDRETKPVSGPAGKLFGRNGPRGRRESGGSGARALRPLPGPS